MFRATNNYLGPITTGPGLVTLVVQMADVSRDVRYDLGS